MSLLASHTSIVSMEALISLPSSHAFRHLSLLPSKPLLLLPSLPFYHRHSIKTHHHILSPTKTTRLHAQLSSSPSTAPPPTTNLPGEENLAGDEKFDWFAQWYSLTPVCNLDKRAPNTKTVIGLDVVIWWDQHEGRWQVFDYQCPHRLAPLSEGRIDSWGRLQCVYHGWCFDDTGSCKYIPQAPSDGPPVTLPTYPCQIFDRLSVVLTPSHLLQTPEKWTSSSPDSYKESPRRPDNRWGPSDAQISHLGTDENSPVGRS